jgi:hypothetical protein
MSAFAHALFALAGLPSDRLRSIASDSARFCCSVAIEITPPSEGPAPPSPPGVTFATPYAKLARERLHVRAHCSPPRNRARSAGGMESRSAPLGAGSRAASRHRSQPATMPASAPASAEGLMPVPGQSLCSSSPVRRSTKASTSSTIDSFAAVHATSYHPAERRRRRAPAVRPGSPKSCRLVQEPATWRRW